MTHNFYLAYKTVTDSFLIPVDIDGTFALSLTTTCGPNTATVTGGTTWTTSGLTYT